MNSIRFMAVGDTGPAKPEDIGIFDSASGLLSRADFRFAQVERVFTDRGSFQEASLGEHSRVDPALVEAYIRGNIDLVGLASNHSLDWGTEGMTDTLQCFRNAGRASVGLGMNISEAREPYIFEKDGIKVGVLGYCSVLAHQAWATPDKPGCAPLRADTYYTPYEYQPGAPPRVVTVTKREDLDAMLEDVRKLKQKVDFTVCSIHWGVHWIAGLIADYQTEIAHAAIDAGCDMILGHHAHLIKGVEVYKGKPVLYSIGNFAMGRSGASLGVLAPEGKYRFVDVYDNPVSPDYTYHHKQYYKHSVIVDTHFHADGSMNVDFWPTYIEDGPRPTVLKGEDPRFAEIEKLIRWSSDRFGTGFVNDGEKLQLVLDQ